MRFGHHNARRSLGVVHRARPREEQVVRCGPRVRLLTYNNLPLTGLEKFSQKTRQIHEWRRNPEKTKLVL